MRRPWTQLVRAMLAVSLAATGASAQCDPHEQAQVFSEAGGPDRAFGRAVATDGVLSVVGSPIDDTPVGERRGAVYIYERQDAGWSKQAKLFASDGGYNDEFGCSVDMDGTRIVVGAEADNTDDGFNAGSAYVFAQVNGVWIEEAKLTASDGLYVDFFGHSVAISGDTVVIGAHFHNVGDKTAAGAAYVFVRQDGLWVEHAILTASDAAPLAHFGSRATLDGDTAVVSATEAEVNHKEHAGTAYVFVRDGDEWTEQAKLTAVEPTEFGAFGRELSLTGGTLACAAKDGGDGFVFLFRRDGESWPLAQVVEPDEYEFAADFATSVSLSEDILAVGSKRKENGGDDNVGAVYIFLQQGETWIEAAQVFASDGADLDDFGDSAAVDRNVLVVGAVRDDNGNGTNAGSAYVFDLGCVADCYPDFTGDGALDLFDFLAFVNAFNDQEAAADCVADGVLDLFDFLCFVNWFNEGC